MLTIDALIDEIKHKLKVRGSLGIRGLVRVFKTLDKDGSKNLDLDDFRWALIDYGINISKEVQAPI